MILADWSDRVEIAKGDLLLALFLMLVAGFALGMLQAASIINARERERRARK